MMVISEDDMRQKIHPDDHFPPDWVPPSEWEYGICQDCHRSFQPALPKQYFCNPCREYTMRNTHWQHRPTRYKGPISRMVKLRKKKSIKAVCEAINLRPSTLYHWDQGATPSDYRMAERLREYLNCRMDQLFSDKAIEKMGNNPRWRQN